jgi:ABC-type multidrug transport system fused ATPase/permease subunit
MENKAEKGQPAWPVVQRLLGMAGPAKGWLATALIMDLLQAAILLLSNDWLRRTFDAVIGKDPARFWHFVWMILAISIASMPMSYLKTYGLGRFSEGTLARLRGVLGLKSTRLPVAYMETRHSGDMLSVLNADLGKLKTLLANNLLDVVNNSVRCLAAFAYILSVNWILALVSTIVTPALFIGVSLLTAPVSKRSEEMQDEIGRVNSIAKDGLSGAMVIKAFNLVEVLDQRFHTANLAALKKGLNVARLRALIDSIGLGLGITPFIIAMGLGGYLVIEGKMTFGALFAFINLLNLVVNPLSTLPSIFASIAEAAGAGKRVFDLVDHEPEPAGGAAIEPGSTDEAAVTFEDVTFGYNEGQPVLKDLSLEIQPGQTVAVVGPSGSGKSTLLKLILGYYPLVKGRLSLFGRDLNEWQRIALRQQMAFVAQDTYLFPVSIGENILLGHPGATQEEMIAAAKLANIHDFIAGLPEGYETGAGEWGGRLSGGQKQRIALARAILKNAPVLLLDEPTSALDTESESLVQQSLERFTQGRTTLVIAHRLSTIKNADRVVVVDDGRIVESGTHDELMARGGLYMDLYHTQFQGNGGMQGNQAQEAGR